MDRRTAAVYGTLAREWIAARKPQPLALRRLAGFARVIKRRGPVADLGCGPGWYAEALRQHGKHALGLDLSRDMLHALRERTPGAAAVRADLGALPFRRGALRGAWAMNCYVHVPAAELPVALAHLHDSLAVGAPVALTLPELDTIEPTRAESARGATSRRYTDESFGGRLLTALSEDRARALLEGAGFERITVDRPFSRPFWLWLSARRALTLPDYVRPKLDLLLCGLNPSPRAAETGIPFGRPGNRFWPAALRAGLVSRDRDPWDALRRGIGFTDLVKRVTGSAAELMPDEYRSGLARVAARVRAERPSVVCFVGLDGWRRAGHRGATAGPIEGGFAGRPAYLMPSTSGRNAHDDLASLARHLRRAARLTTSRRAG